MSGYKKDGAQAVYIAGVESGSEFNGSATQEITPSGAHVKNNSLSSAVTLTPPAGANTLTLSVEDQPVRIRYDGSAATNAIGFRLVNGDMVSFQFTSGVTFSIIETVATSTIQYQWGIV